MQPRPVGLVYRLTPYPAETTDTPSLTAAETAAIKACWDRLRPDLDAVVVAVKSGALNVRQTASLWSRAANTDGVMLQQSDRVAEAAPLFDLALQLNPENLAALVNSRVNAALRAHQPITDEVRKPLEGKSLAQMLEEHGPLDEPKALFSLARGAEISERPLLRSAAMLFLRARRLDPGFTAATFGYISACLNAGDPNRALAAVRELRAKETLGPDDLVKAVRLEFGALYLRGQRGDAAESAAAAADAEKLLKQARVDLPKSPVPLDLLSQLYLQQERYDELLQQLDLWQTLKPGDEAIPLRRVIVNMQRKQFDQALPLLDKLLHDEPENEPARANRAICLLQLNRLDESRRDYELLLRKHPDEHILHYGLGEVAAKKKDTAAALEHFQRYLALAPTNTLEYTNVLASLKQLKGGK